MKMKIEYIPVGVAALLSAVALVLAPSKPSLLRLGWIWDSVPQCLGIVQDRQKNYIDPHPSPH